MNKNKDIYIYSLQLEGYLRRLGFQCYKVVPNIKYPEYNVFVHEYSDELVSAIEKYKKEGIL